MPLRDLIPTSTDESETDRDGPLSTLTEWHALILGLAVGAVSGLTGRYELAAVAVACALGLRVSEHSPAIAELRKEPWYFAGGLLVTLAIALVV